MTYESILPITFSSLAGTGSNVRDGSLKDKIVKIRYILPHIMHLAAPSFNFRNLLNNTNVPDGVFYTEEEDRNLTALIADFGTPGNSKQQINYKTTIVSSFEDGSPVRLYSLELVNDSRLDSLDESLRRFFYGDDIVDSTYYYSNKLFFWTTPTRFTSSTRNTLYPKENNNDVGLALLLESVSNNFDNQNTDLPEYNLDVSNKQNLINPRYAPEGMTALPIQAYRKFLISNPAIRWMSSETYDYHKGNISDMYFTKLEGNELYNEISSNVDLVYNELIKLFDSNSGITSSEAAINNYFDGLIAKIDTATDNLSYLLLSYTNSFLFFITVVPLEYEFNRILTDYTFAVDTENKAASERLEAYGIINDDPVFESDRDLLREIEDLKSEGSLVTDYDVSQYLSSVILSGRVDYDPDFVTKIARVVEPARSGMSIDMHDVIYYLERL